MLVSVSTTGFARPSSFIVADMELLGISGASVFFGWPCWIPGLFLSWIFIFVYIHIYIYIYLFKPGETTQIVAATFFSVAWRFPGLWVLALPCWISLLSCMSQAGAHSFRLLWNVGGCWFPLVHYTPQISNFWLSIAVARVLVASLEFPGLRLFPCPVGFPRFRHLGTGKKGKQEQPFQHRFTSSRDDHQRSRLPTGRAGLDFELCSRCKVWLRK